jgi:superfamily II DNA/RNA helicase
MFSATMPGKIRKLADSILKNPAEISIAISRPAEKINQKAYMVYEEQKPGVFKEVMSESSPDSTIIFTSSRAKVKEILKELKTLKMHARGISSDLDQKEREEVLNDFRSKKLGILVSTDVLSRGIDIENIGMVLNYDVPAEPEDYIHRIGRTARAEATGTAITFITPKDQIKFSRIEKLLGKEIEKGTVPAELGAAPSYNPLHRKKSGNKPFNRSKGGHRNQHKKN